MIKNQYWQHIHLRLTKHLQTQRTVEIPHKNICPLVDWKQTIFWGLPNKIKFWMLLFSKTSTYSNVIKNDNLCYPTTAKIFNVKKLICNSRKFCSTIYSNSHYVKSVLFRSYSGLHFPAFGLNMERYSVLNVSDYVFID